MCRGRRSCGGEKRGRRPVRWRRSSACPWRVSISEGGAAGAAGAEGQLAAGARKLCRSAGSMVAQMEDMDAKELKELTALLRELVTLEERTDKGPETVKVVLAKEAEEWSR